MASRESPDDFADLTDEELDALSAIDAADVDDAMANAPAVLRPYLDAEPVDPADPGDDGETP